MPSALENHNRSQNCHEIDPLFKEVMTFCFGKLRILLQTQVEVSRLPRTMDVLVVLKRNREQERVRQNTPFGYFRVYNVLEFKGMRDALTIDGYHLILGRVYLYIGEHKIRASEMTLTIVCARKPRKVLQSVPFQALGEGHYLCTTELSVHLIVLNELQIHEKNYPLLLFASSKSKFQDFLRDVCARENFDYLRYAYTVRPQVTKEVLSMPGKYNLPKKNLEFIVNDIGQELLPLFRKEDLLKHLSPEEVLRHLSPEEVLSHLQPEDLVRGLGPEKLKQLKQMLDQMDEKRNSPST